MWSWHEKHIQNKMEEIKLPMLGSDWSGGQRSWISKEVEFVLGSGKSRAELYDPTIIF